MLLAMRARTARRRSTPAARCCALATRRPRPAARRAVPGHGGERARSGVDPTEWTFAKEIVLLDVLLEQAARAEVEVQAIQVGPAVFADQPGRVFLPVRARHEGRQPVSLHVPRRRWPTAASATCRPKRRFGPHGGGYETRLTSYSNLEVTAGTQMLNAALELARQMKPGKPPSPPKATSFHGALVLRQRTAGEGMTVVPSLVYGGWATQGVEPSWNRAMISRTIHSSTRLNRNSSRCNVMVSPEPSARRV